MKKRKLTVYIAHPMIHKNLVSQDWKGEFTDAIDHLPIKIIDPSKMGLQEKCHRKIVEENKKAIRQSDFVVAYVTTPSAGTAMEVLYANNSGVPVLAFSVLPVSAWIKSHVYKVYNNIADLVAVLEKSCV